MPAAAVGDSDTGVRWGKVGREGLCGSLDMKADRKKKTTEGVLLQSWRKTEEIGTGGAEREVEICR